MTDRTAIYESEYARAMRGEGDMWVGYNDEFVHIANAVKFARSCPGITDALYRRLIDAAVAKEAEAHANFVAGT